MSYILAIAALFSVWSCSKANLTGSHRISDDQRTEDASDRRELADDRDLIEESMIAIEPVSIGGASLTCRYQERQEAGVHTVGCDIVNSDKQSLANYIKVNFALNSGKVLPHTIAMEALPYRLRIAAVDLADNSERIHAVFETQQKEIIEISLPVNGIEAKPELQVLTKFGLGVVTIRTYPQEGQSGPIVLSNLLCLENSRVVFSGGTKIQAKTCVPGKVEQIFSLTQNAPGLYVVSQNNGTSCFDLPLINGAYVSRVNFYSPCHGGRNEQFGLVASEGFITMNTATNNNLCLSMDNEDLVLISCF